jgi:glycine/serine hydroxymethyltransferase
VATFSTYKSFGGPAGGAIVSNDAQLTQRIAAACQRGHTSSHHIAIDIRRFGGGPEAARTLATANILLFEIGLPDP